jgi:hypothetical protein
MIAMPGPFVCCNMVTLCPLLFTPDRRSRRCALRVTRDLLLLHIISNMLRVHRLQEHSAYMYRAVFASAVLAAGACGLAGATAVAVVDEGEDSRLHCVGLFMVLGS